MSASLIHRPAIGHQRIIETVDFDHVDLVANAAGGASNMALAQQLPLGAIPQGVFVKVTTAWTGGTASAVDITIGDSANADSYNSEGPFDLFPGINGGGQHRNAAAELVTAASDILIAFAVTGDDYANLVAGQFTITVTYLFLV